MHSEQHPRWTPSSIYRRAKVILREEGLKSLWFKVLGETVYRRLLLLECVMEGTETEGTAATGQLSRLTEDDLPRYALFRPNADLEQVRQRLLRGEFCFLMTIDREIVHSCWVTATQAYIEYLECTVRLAPDVCYAYEAYTHPAFRGRGIASARVRQMEPHLMREGHRRVLCVVEPENGPAVYFNTSTGNEIVGRIGYYQFGPWRRYFCKVDPGREAALLDPRRV